MTTEGRNQRDLFEQATMPQELSSDVRTALTPLLRVLRTEAGRTMNDQKAADPKVKAVRPFLLQVRAAVLNGDLRERLTDKPKQPHRSRWAWTFESAPPLKTASSPHEARSMRGPYVA
jgi:hypothetical protein